QGRAGGTDRVAPPFLFPEIRRNVFEVLLYREVLRAFCLALTALHADRCKRRDAAEYPAEGPGIDPARLLLCIVDMRLVVEFEAPGDIHAIRAGHAVFAPGAGDLYPRGKLVPDFSNDREILTGERAGQPLLCVCDVLSDLLHGRHTGEDDGDFGMVPDPAEAPLCRGAPGRSGCKNFPDPGRVLCQ